MSENYSLEPFVSLIIPAYNAENFLQKSVQSCLEQSHKNLEILIIDDGSTDSTLQIAHEFAQNHTRIKVFAQSQNRGTFAARARGIEESRGDFIAFVDADDWIEPEFCAQMVAAIMRKGDFANATADFAVCHYFLGDLPKIRVFDNKVAGTRIVNWACLYRRALLLQALSLCTRVFGEIPNGLFSGEDTLMGLLIISFVRDCSVMNAPLYHYTQHDESTTHSAALRPKRLQNAALCFDLGKTLQAHPAWNPSLPVREFAHTTSNLAIYEFYILQRHTDSIMMLQSEQQSYLVRLPPYLCALLCARRYHWRWRNDLRIVLYCLSFGVIKR